MIPTAAAPISTPASENGPERNNELRKWLEDRDLPIPPEQLERLYQKLVDEGVTKTLVLKEFDQEELVAICAELGLNRITRKRFARAVQNLDPATIALPMPAATQPEQTAIRQLAERARELDDTRKDIEARRAAIADNVDDCKQKIHTRFDALINQLVKRKQRELAKLDTDKVQYSRQLQQQHGSVRKAIDACQKAKEICSKALNIADIQNLNKRKDMILAGVRDALAEGWDRTEYGPGNFKVEFDQQMFRVANRPDLCRVTVNKITYTPEIGLYPQTVGQGSQAGPSTVQWDAKGGSDELVLNKIGNEVSTTTKTFGGFHTIRTKRFLEKGSGVHRFEIRPWWENESNAGEMLIGVVTQGYRSWKNERDPSGCFLGRDAHSWGWYLWAPWKSHAVPGWDQERERYGKPVKNKDIILMIVDMNKRTLEFELSTNGGGFRKLGPCFTDLASIVAPAVSLKGQLSVQSPQRSKCVIRRLRQ